MCKASKGGGEQGKMTITAFLPATDPRGDNNEMERLPNWRIFLLNRIQECDGERMVDEGEGGAVMFDEKMAKVKEV